MRSIVGHKAWLMPAFFIVGLFPGLWYPMLSNILAAYGHERSVWLAHLVIPLASILSPLTFGALADRRIPAQKLLGIILMGGSWLLYLAFYSLEQGAHIGWFLTFHMLNSIVVAPVWPLIGAVALQALPHPEKQFPLYRIWGTLGWLSAGLIISYIFQADHSVEAGKLAALLRFGLGWICFLLPATPVAKVGKIRLRQLLGSDALKILKNRDHRVFFVTTTLLSIPLAAYYAYGPRLLTFMGDPRPGATMTLGQVPEIAALLILPFMARWRIKWLLLIAITAATVRYGFFVLSSATGEALWAWPGVSLHGVIYTFYFITGQIFLNRHVELGLRNQAQTLLSLCSAGLGLLIGTALSGILYAVLVEGNPSLDAWMQFWNVFTLLCAGVGIYFLLAYRGKRGQK